MAVALSFLTDGDDGKMRLSTGDDQHKGYQGVSPHLSRAIVCRAKDRINPDYDAIKAGGNRDILLNLWLKLEDSDWILAELQLHVKPLFDLKHDLHVLYKGARILGALEPETVEHQGQLTAQALDRADRGIVLHLKCSYSTLDGHQEKLKKLLQKDECPLLELSLAGFSAVWQDAWKGKKKKYWPPITEDSLGQSRRMNDFNCSLHDLLVNRRDQQLHCHRLRTLDLKGRPEGLQVHDEAQNCEPQLLRAHWRAACRARRAQKPGAPLSGQQQADGLHPIEVRWPVGRGKGGDE
jgi:hypothetical protein